MLGLGNGKKYRANELEPFAGHAREMELSRALVGLVDVLYALVLIQGAVYYRYIFTIGDYFHHSTRFAPVVLALILTYFTTIHSFVDYHIATQDQRYKLLTPRKRAVDLVRFYLDLVIVGLYSFILLKFHRLVGSASADISVALWAFPAVFFFYLLWGILRTRTSDHEKSYSWLLLVIFLIFYAGLAVGYTSGPGGPSSLRNSCAVGAALLLMLVYRALNWTQNPRYEGN